MTLIYICNYAGKRMFIYSWHTSWNFFFFLRKIKTKVCFRWSKTEIKRDDDMTEIELFLLYLHFASSKGNLLFNLIISKSFEIFVHRFVFINFWTDREIFRQCIKCIKKIYFITFVIILILFQEVSPLVFTTD